MTKSKDARLFLHSLEWENDLFPRIRALQSQFEQGDVLAAFESCFILQEAEAPVEAYPDWVLGYLTSTAAEYFSKGPLIGPKAVTPREFLEMTAKERRLRIEPLDRIARLSGKLGRTDNTAWEWRAEHGRDAYVQAYLDDLMRKRDQGEPVFLKISAGGGRKKVPVFTEQGPNKGTFRGEVLNEIARWFRVRGEGNRNRAQTMRRRYWLTLNR